MKVEVRELRTPEEFAAAESVQKSAWGMEDLMVTPKEIMIAMATNGGLVLGAFRGKEMLGMCIAFPGVSRGRLYLYSHMTGVSREFQSMGVGQVLKLKQKEIAIQRGFQIAAWTFDPIIAKNAYFNFTKLGVVARVYFRNYYGPMRDSINFGWQTDRFLAESFLRSDISQQARAKAKALMRDAHQAVKVREKSGYIQCSDWDVDLSNPVGLVTLPRDIVRIKKLEMEDAERWRLGTREVFLEYFRGGFAAVDLLRQGRDFAYVVLKTRIPRLFTPNSSGHA